MMKERSARVPGPGNPFDLEETRRVDLRTRAHTTRGTPSHARSGAQKFAVEFVCRARAPTVGKKSQRRPARSQAQSAAPRAVHAVPSPPRRARGDGEQLRRRENPAAATESL